MTGERRRKGRDEGGGWGEGGGKRTGINRGAREMKERMGTGQSAYEIVRVRTLLNMLARQKEGEGG